MARPVNPMLLPLARAALFGLSPVESGGAELYPFAPFGGAAPLLTRVVELARLGPVPRPGRPLEPRLAERAASVYLDFLEALPGLLRTARLEPGEYEIPSVARGLADISERSATLGLEGPDDTAAELAFAAAIADGFAAHRETLTVTETLLALARQAEFRVQWNFEPWGPFPDPKSRKAALAELIEAQRAAEDTPPGTPFVWPVQSVDGKRPYGLRTYYYWDLEDLGVPGIVADGPPEHGRPSFTAATQKEINALHLRTPQVCQVLARFGRWA
jgi:hypothetical protein